VSNYPGLRRPRYYRRQAAKAAKKLEPQVFKPIYRRPFMAQTKITMLLSAFGHNPDGSDYSLVVGEEAYVDAKQADEFIIKGYATGNLSRNYSDDERAQIRSNIQYVRQQAEAMDLAVNTSSPATRSGGIRNA
jgi:hypothetical protein